MYAVRCMLSNVCCAMYALQQTDVCQVTKRATCGAMPMLASLHNEVARPSVCAYEAQPPVAAAMPPYDL